MNLARAHLHGDRDELPADVEALRQRIDGLGPWFHNLNIGGVWTAPNHFLGDYPGEKFRRFADHLPDDLTGRTVLDIGCNAGFYSLEMKRRGAARVLGIDSDERYLAQARFAAETLGQDGIEFRRLDVYDVGALGEQFDVVIFMGVLYHLRHPLLALDLIREHVAGDMLIFQSMQRGSKQLLDVAEDYDFNETDHFFESGYPKLHFVEHEYAGDWTNWWVPNRACAEAMLRAAGFSIEKRAEDEVYICRRADRPYEGRAGSGAVYPERHRREAE
ncbi:TIGR04290 family methyltransferase [Sphingosinicella sp. CPCC 101087]|uniref:TIGR04290 family methyltransferase n=1 Tax=Sphingosinicella sp. CPCC 101087 TaxID=2497754 RepID=UPI00101B6ABF|nr:TIGR04290 family methyltransferase [Sphingosinicella sp. CPCC 101087]